MNAPNERPEGQPMVYDGSVDAQSVEGGSGEAGGEAPASIGAYLSGQRRLRGITLEDLATQTHIPLRSLERLEGGAFDEHPDGFVRGFVRTVAAALGLDPDETVTRMLSEPGTAADAQPHRAATVWRVALLLVFLSASLVAAALPVWLGSQAEGEAEVGPSAALTRRDPVRALAEGEGLASPPSPALRPPGAGASGP